MIQTKEKGREGGRERATGRKAQWRRIASFFFFLCFSSPNFMTFFVQSCYIWWGDCTSAWRGHYPLKPPPPLAARPAIVAGMALSQEKGKAGERSGGRS